MTPPSSDPINNFESNAGSFRGAAAPRAEMARRVMDVEELLSWTFRSELPKDRGLGGGMGEPSAVSPMFRMGAFGTRVDNWNREPGFPSAMGPPHPDALLVEAAVERLADHADQAIEDTLDLAPDIGALGVNEEQAVRRALGMMPAIVARCAKLQQRPFWHSGTVPLPLRANNGRPRVVRWEAEFFATSDGREVEHEVLVDVEVREKGIYPFGAYSPLRYDPDPQSIVDERAEYLVWWGALNAIAADLAGKLASIAVIPPGAAQRPWIEPADLGKPPRIFEDLAARVYRREQSEAAAAHRMLGLRRSAGARRGRHAAGQLRAGAPTRPAQRACAVV